MEAFDAFINSMLTIDRWPFWSAAIIFALIGHFMSQHFFTRDRAYAKGAWEPFWWWGRESQVLHPVVSGLVLGKLWPNPEGHVPPWPAAASCMYFAVAGAVSLVVWVVVQGIAKKKGVVLTLPGDSDKPPAK